MSAFGRVAVTAITVVIAAAVELAVAVVIDLIDDGAMKVTVVILSIHASLVIYSSMFCFCSEKCCYSSRYCCSCREKVKVSLFNIRRKIYEGKQSVSQYFLHHYQDNKLECFWRTNCL